MLSLNRTNSNFGSTTYNVISKSHSILLKSQPNASVTFPLSEMTPEDNCNLYLCPRKSTAKWHISKDRSACALSLCLISNLKIIGVGKSKMVHISHMYSTVQRPAIYHLHLHLLITCPTLRINSILPS
jgi:hypothetical protein